MPVKPGSGVNVMTPVAVSTVYVPWPATVSVVTLSPLASSSRGEAGTIAAPVGPGVSFVDGFSEIGVFCGVVRVSGFATGGAGPATVTVYVVVARVPLESAIE